MSVPALLLSCALSFLFLLVVFRPLEVLFAARPGQRFFRPAWLTDLCFFLGQYLLFNGAVFWILARLEGGIDRVVAMEFRHAVAAQPWWLQALEVILLSDLCVFERAIAAGTAARSPRRA